MTLCPLLIFTLQHTGMAGYALPLTLTEQAGATEASNTILRDGTLAGLWKVEFRFGSTTIGPIAVRLEWRVKGRIWTSSAYRRYAGMHID